MDQVRGVAAGGTVEGTVGVAGPSGHGSARRRERERQGRGPPPQPSGGGGAEADGAANVVRVDFRRLDTLLEVLGEGLIEQAAVAEAFRRVARRAGPPRACPSWTARSSRWRRR